MSDAVHFADRIVIPYKPRVIVLYEGDNDIAAGKSPEKVCSDFKAFVKKVHSALPRTRIVFIPIKPSLARWKLWPVMQKANACIKRVIDKDERLFYVDIVPPMSGPDGRPRPELFRADGLHLNDKGYRLWSRLVKPLIAVSEKRKSTPAPSSSKVRFVMHRVGSFRNEVCGVGDFDGDGKLDIVSGPILYLAPTWRARVIRTIGGEVDAAGCGYYWDFMNAPLDVDGDGRLDIVTCSWHGKRAEWYRNPGPRQGPWTGHLIEENGNYEHGDLWDIDGDGKRLEILPGVRETIWYEVGKLPDGTRGVVKHVVSTKKREWGVGAGDVNGDGRIDILRPGAWYEAPADPRRGKWKEHPLAVGGEAEGTVGHTPQIWIYDVNADGANDIITSSAHGHGIFWYEQVRNPSGGESSWKRHVIDSTWSQAHSLTLADLDADGDLDLVTGKRFMAHNGHDPDAYGPLGVYWYELVRGRKARWIKHVISYDRGIGSGLNLPVVDLDGDGDLDVVVTGKFGGPVWFENKLK